MNRKIWGVIGITLLAFILGLFIGFRKGLTAFTDIANTIEAQSGEKQVKYDGPKYTSIIIAQNAVKKGAIFNRSDFVIFTGTSDEVLVHMLNRCILPAEISQYVGHPVQGDINKDDPLFRTDLIPR